MSNETGLFTYGQDTQNIIRTLSPTVEISYQVPAEFTHRLLKYMAKGLIKVHDKDGNRLEVYYE